VHGRGSGLGNWRGGDKGDAGEPEGTIEVSVVGRVTAQRMMGKAAFLDVRDATGRIQLHFRRDHLENFEALSLVDLGDFGGNESTDGSFNTPDGAFDGLDIEGFLLALNDPAGYAAIQPPGVGGVSAIPEPAALGLLAPLGLLMARRRR
jgi:hypothetical protein